MREYSPKRRTALVLAGSGTSGAYHAGVLKALDESGVKLDLVVGSGWARWRPPSPPWPAAAPLRRGRLLGGVSWDAFFRLRPALRVAILLLACSFGVFLLPVVLALMAGLLFPLLPDRRPRRARLTARVRRVSGRARPWCARRTWPRSPCRSSCCARWPSGPPGRGAARRRRLPRRFECAPRPAPGAGPPAAGLWEVARGPPSRRARLRRRSWAASTWPCSPRTSGSRASAS